MKIKSSRSVRADKAGELVACTIAVLYAGLLTTTLGCGSTVDAGEVGGGSETTYSATGGSGGNGGATSTSTTGGSGGNGGNGGAPCMPIDDNNPCTDDICDNELPVHEPTAAGTACNGGGTLCDGAGACVECLDGGDCASGMCTQNTCAEPTCMDGVKNGDETALDCGGSCAACGDGEPCAVAADCSSNVCTSEVCQAPTCNDGVMNGTESDTDCGGTCPKCPLRAACTTAEDCMSKNCVMNLCAVGVLGTYAGSRSGYSPVDGSVTYPSRTWLETAAPAGAGIALGAIDEATDASLAPFAAFLLIMDGETLPLVEPSASEAQALKDFVLGGGGLAIFYGLSAGWPAPLRSAFDVNMFPRCISPGSATPTMSFPVELGNGPYGVVGPLNWSNNCHEEMSFDVGSKAVAIITDASISPIHIEAAYIPPNALGPGSGPVVFFADFFWSYSSYLNGSPDFEPLFKNSIAHVLNH